MSLERRLAREIAARLSRACETRGRAALLVSGGRALVRLFEELRTQVLDWSCVSIALADECWVHPADPQSNERIVRQVLLRKNAAAARFVGLKNAAPSPLLGAEAAWQALASVPRPFDVTVLGMGDDGDTASLLPGSPNLPKALDPSAAGACVAMWARSAPHARLSLNLSALLDSRQIWILISGEEKLRTYRTACSSDCVEEMPIRAILHQERTPVQVIWGAAAAAQVF
jgi:6-phosphogluconolactonase